MLAEYEGQDGRSELCQEDDEDEQEELQDNKNTDRKDERLNNLIIIKNTIWENTVMDFFVL